MFFFSFVYCTPSTVHKTAKDFTLSQIQRNRFRGKETPHTETMISLGTNDHKTIVISNGDGYDDDDYGIRNDEDAYVKGHPTEDDKESQSSSKQSQQCSSATSTQHTLVADDDGVVMICIGDNDTNDDDGDDDTNDDTNYTTSSVKVAIPQEQRRQQQQQQQQQQHQQRLLLRFWLCVYSVVFFTCHTGFFFTRNIPLGIIRVQDGLNMLNPIVLVPVYYYIGEWIGDPHTKPRLHHAMVFLLGVVMYVHGDGMHLAGNAINRYTTAVNVDQHDYQQHLVDVIDFYDERIGHYYTYIGIMVLQTCWILRQVQVTNIATTANDEEEGGKDNTNNSTTTICTSSRRSFLLFVTCSIVHGVSLFVMFVEGRCVVLGWIYYAMILVGYSLYYYYQTEAAVGTTITTIQLDDETSTSSEAPPPAQRQRQRRMNGRRRQLQLLPILEEPIHCFTMVYTVTGIVLLIGWAIWQRGFPEITDAWGL